MKKLFSFLLLLSMLLLGTSCGSRYHQPDAHAKRKLSIYPDYANVTLPWNIAPTNFEILHKGEAYQTEIGIIGRDAEILVQSAQPTVEIDETAWHQLLKMAAGQAIFFRISVKEAGKWVVYPSITNRISRDAIDSFLVYRLIYPGYELWHEMGIYQRNLTSFEQTPIVENKDFNRQCVNCHSFNHNDAQQAMLHVRGKDGGTLIYRHGRVEKVASKADALPNGLTYPAWHPNGKLIAFSTNEIQQFFHSAGKKTIEVADLAADLVVYDVEHHRVQTFSALSLPTHAETFPAWAPNGRQLYFCRARMPQSRLALDSIRYDLCRVTFDAQQMKFGNVETIYPASKFHRSASFPVVSPDGNFVVFTLSDYGNFSIWHPESNLWMLNVRTGECRELKAVNSPNVDSWHGFSASGKWMVLSSKRLNGGWAQPWFTHFDSKTGQATKPFVLPQKTPRFYDGFLKTYNRPELITTSLKAGQQLLRAIPTEATPLTIDYAKH